MDFSAILSLVNLEPSMHLNALVFGIGLLVNIIKILIQCDISLKDYILVHPQRTTLSLTSLATAFYSIEVMVPGASMLVYFLAGYSIDSLVNKAPMSQKAVMDNLLNNIDNEMN